MRKKILFTSLILFGFALSGMAEVCLADVSANLEQTKSNIISLVQKGNYAEAEVQMQKLIADFPKSEPAAKAIHDVAQQYQETEQFDKAVELSQYVLDNWPRTEHSVWLQMRLAVCSIARGDDYMAREAISRLNSEYSQDPNLPRTLYLLAEQYKLSWRYEEAKNLYQLIIQQHPDSSYAGQAELGISRADVMSLIVSQNYNQAKVALDKLVADFSGHPDLPEALYWISDKYEWLNRYEQAKRIYQQIIQDHPDSSYASKAKLGILRVDAMSLIISQDYNGAKEALDKLVADFNDHPDLPETLYRISERYRWLSRFEEEKRIYQQIIQNHPDSLYASKAKLGISSADVMSVVMSQNYDRPEETLDKLVADFSGHPDLPRAILLVGEQYYKEGLSKESEGLAEQARERFEKAAEIWDGLINKLSNSALMPEACCWAGDCYFKLGKHEESIRRFQKVVDNYPGYEYAWHALFMVGCNYESMKNSDLISKSQADPKIKAAYTRLLEKYPTCPAAKGAREWMDSNNSK